MLDEMKEAQHAFESALKKYHESPDEETRAVMLKAAGVYKIHRLKQLAVAFRQSCRDGTIRRIA
jgi:hypothetical protein